MAANRLSTGRRRARRGSLERPINARLYRATFGAVALGVVVVAFSIVRPAALPAPALPANFDGQATKALAVDLAGRYPDRSPGSSGSLAAATWFRDQMRQYDLPVHSDTWRTSVPGLGSVRLQNLWAVAAGQSRQAIVVMAHRDDTGDGPGANDNATGTAALVELARGYALTAAPGGIRSGHTIVFLSTDAGAFGGLGALRFAQKPPFRVVAAIDLDAIGGTGRPRIEIAGDSPRSPAASLVATAARRVQEQTGIDVAHASVVAQLIDLGFPFTLHGQGPFVARGIPALTLTTAGARPPAAFTDRTTALSTARIAGLGRAAQQLVGSLDQGLELAQGTTTFVWVGGRFVRGWAIELLLFTLLLPYLVAVVDLFAHCRRRRIPLLPAARSLRSRIGAWLFAGLAFYVLRFLGAWPTGPARPPNPSSRIAGDWPVLALIALAVISFAGWLVARQRLVPRRYVTPEERLGGQTAALLGIGVVSLLVLATNPYALIFFVPALHAWLWLPQVRVLRAPLVPVLLVLGALGPLAIVFSLGTRFGLGFDAPWYLAELVSLGYVHVPAVAITLAGTACAAQLVAVASHRYAPYPERRERPPRGPLRGLVRALVLTARARRA
ncbi:MAG TPA: M28 family peptidase [Gaiellaceae bacterium]|nr:M28 family peptidase [Gaiellaceae bacterium]